MGKSKIIIDTNLWVSFLLTKQFSFLDDLLENHKIELIFSQELMSEFLGVVNRPKLRKYFSDENLEMILDIIDQHADFVKVTSTTNVCRDEKDNFLLSLAKDGFANYLITGDQDLLVIKQFERTEIITIAEFKSRN
ncbi:MAG: putative toxin-antitoxin system toxin component, PIN family [Bacteroidota bacterium]|nr:putative toxin-antitoxin system toxin component, PIN family [Bacteroidota bacterium]MDO9613542.1 putative toxin-antitoxin system toxin component, PIN family [Bacteroidota bacterium]